MSDWGQLEQPQASDKVVGGYRLTWTQRNGREQAGHADFIFTPEGLAGMFEKKEQYEKWGFGGFEFWVEDEEGNFHPYEEVVVPVEIEEAPQATESISTIEPQESDTIRVHVACYPIVSGIVWAGNDLSEAKRIFDDWTQNHQVSQASVQLRHADRSGWSIQWENPALYWDRHDRMHDALSAGKSFTGFRI